MSSDSSVEDDLVKARPFLWLNPSHDRDPAALSELPWTLADILDAERRFQACNVLLSNAFPEIGNCGDVIESPLKQTSMISGQTRNAPSDNGELLIKCDHRLPIAGSVKARGGFHEVIAFAEELLIRNGLARSDQDFSYWTNDEVRSLFGKYTIVVGSTGNLGLSIGLISKFLGFNTTVHMSKEAKAWKKEKLRTAGVSVIEHEGDYSRAVEAGRELAKRNSCCYFVDDENSPRLFLGYAVAALRLQRQLCDKDIAVDSRHPLFVYIPCGVGGAPGGICFGLRQVLGENVHVFFAEPAQSACMLLALSEGQLAPRSVYDIGLNNTTVADGLAVPRASALVANVVERLVSGIFTVSDRTLYRNLYLLQSVHGQRVEPSAAAGLSGVDFLVNTNVGIQYLKKNTLLSSAGRATHIVWTTGGMHLPNDEYESYWRLGQASAVADEVR